MRKFRTVLMSSLVTLLPVTALASTLPPFYDGIEFTLTQGEESSYLLELDPCDGAMSNCHTRSYFGNNWVPQDTGMDWPEVNGAGVSWECPNDMLCLSFFFEPLITGRWNLSFGTTYERWTYLGGDDSGSEFVVPDVLENGHSFTVNVIAPVPLPGAALMLGGGLAGLGALRRRRAGRPG